ncbi:DUF1659 domain-containing protein [Clostridium intestinale]|uniref:DUF1659 domain-containing protein n=1 Tax=Clostridium intestinale DSM 6191 TaxID=1121320 RepID=A0A1M5T3M6_9CLOT|nr:DUF1659 domain-containing protein [Clostridium intestinale]MDF2950098.1 hypothetical protein [Sedimentibacter sp.]SHH45200.1 Protein of unknown function [Clostridium intestinale DSM 6191]
MSIQTIPQNLSLVIKINTGTNASGAPIYKRKSLNNIKSTASNESLHAVAEAISAVLADDAEGYLTILTSELIEIE